MNPSKMNLRSPLFYFFPVFILLLTSSLPALAATENVIHQFIPFGNGISPKSSLTPDSQGNFYGTTYEGGSYGWGTVYRLTRSNNGTWTQTVLHSFASYSDGAWPIGNVVVDSAGNIYGVTSNGGTPGLGLVYEISPSSTGWTETIIHTFTGTNGDGAVPVSGLVMDSAGNLYGTDYSMVFELSPSPAGWVETTVHQFSGRLPDCARPQGVTLDAAGNLYGVAISQFYSSSYNQPKFGLGCEVLFELSPAAGGKWSFTAVRDFTGVNLTSNLAVDAQGNIYGATLNSGQIFKLIKGPANTWTWKLLYQLQPDTDGGYVFGDLILDPQGNLYGATESGGACSTCGTVFKLTPNQNGSWTETILYAFQSGNDGSNPWAGVYLDKAGNVYGTTSQGGFANAGTVFELSPGATGTWTENQMYAFPSTDGDDIYSGLVADSAGNLYGTTALGGTGLCPGGSIVGCGTVYKLSRNSEGQWAESVIHNFTAANGDGEGPLGGLIIDSLGNLYGTTVAGGIPDGGLSGSGIVYELSPDGSGGWTENILYQFVGGTHDGNEPLGNLALDSSGNLYGVTQFGGTFGGGILFRLQPSSNGSWTETIIHSFGHNDGYMPQAGVTIDSAGNLYGTTFRGAEDFDGEVYEFSPATGGLWTEKILHAFSGQADGDFPESALILDSAGNLYGTTVGGGTNGCNCGVVFELSPTSSGPWQEKILYSFGANSSDGTYPLGNVTFDQFGNLWGTTTASTDPQGSCGIVFELTPATSGNWSESIAHYFSGYPSDGCQPYSGVIFDTAGNLYGTTRSGGINDFYDGGGTVFEITP